jgi:glycosyltransferase involved in cell wall biosynthesis
MKAGTKKPTVMMIGTNPAAKGGISSVIRMYEATGLFRSKVFFLASYKGGGLFKNISFFPIFMARYCWTLLTQPAIQIAHVHIASYGSCLRKSIVVALAKATGRKVILHVHGAEFHLFYSKMPAYAQGIIRKMLRSCDVIIALSQQWQDRLYSISQNPDIRVIYNPTILREPQSTDHARDSDAVNFLFMGRLGKRKGVYDIIESARRLKVANVKISLYGDGEIDNVRSRVSAAGVEDKVQVCGWIDGNLKDETFRRAHVLLLPSYNEGLPISVLEAMAYGMPVVASEVGGIPEAIEDGVNGYLIHPGDCDRLAESIDRLASSSELRSRMGQSGYQLAARKFALSVIIEQLESLYDELARQ